MNHRVPVTELESAKSHSHPAFDVSRKKVDGAVFDHNFQIGIEKLQNEIEIRFR
jgi:hypothetical protein